LNRTSGGEKVAGRIFFFRLKKCFSIHSGKMHYPPLCEGRRSCTIRRVSRTARPERQEVVFSPAICFGKWKWLTTALQKL
jgi:hypothetical protein